MFRDRREARRLGLDPKEYRDLQRSVSSGGPHAFQRGHDAIAHITHKSGLSGHALWEWWVAYEQQGSRAAGTLREGLLLGAAAHGVSLQAFIEQPPAAPDPAPAAARPAPVLPDPIARLYELAVHDKPPVFRAPSEQATIADYPISAHTHATVDAAGSIAATRGRNLASKAVGTVATTVAGLGPLGAFMYGNAKETIHDGRELYLMVVDPDWHYSLMVHPDLGQATREIAAAINRVAKGQATTGQAATHIHPAAANDTSPAANKIAQLRELSDLRAAGTITDAEFDQLKRELLN